MRDVLKILVMKTVTNKKHMCIAVFKSVLLNIQGKMHTYV